MDQLKHTNLISGFNERKQLELAVDAAQKMVGYATMRMDPEGINDAKRAIQDAKILYQNFLNNNTGVDQQFLNEQIKRLSECEHQLQEAEQI